MAKKIVKAAAVVSKSIAKTSAKTPAAKGPKGAVAGKASGWDVAAKAFASKWQKAREAQDKSNFDVPDIDDGTYFAQATGAKCGFTKKQVPWVSIQFVLMAGDFEGLAPSKFCRLINPDDPDDDRGMEYFAKTIRHLGYDATELTLADMPDLCEAITKDKPYCQIAVKNTIGKDGSRYQECYVNKLLDENGDEIS